MRPRIGITTSTLDRAPEGAIQVSAATHLAYARQIYLAGGLPLLLPNLPEEADVEEVLLPLDGVLFSGGGDIDPAYWLEPPHPTLGLIDHVRDKFEIALFKAALRRDLPVLGICRGVQVMAVATGGDLWQDIPSQCPHGVQHKQVAPRQHPCHTITVTPDSLLAHILWPEGTTCYTIAVNSFHHQAPRKCGIIATVMATGPDGLTEALCVADARFILGVQWHPEDMADTDHRQACLFTALVAAATGQA